MLNSTLKVNSTLDPTVIEMTKPYWTLIEPEGTPFQLKYVEGAHKKKNPLAALTSASHQPSRAPQPSNFVPENHSFSYNTEAAQAFMQEMGTYFMGQQFVEKVGDYMMGKFGDTLPEKIGDYLLPKIGDILQEKIVDYMLSKLSDILPKYNDFRTHQSQVEV